MTPKDLEEACKQPLAIATVLSMMTIVPIHFIGMFTIFLKLNQQFNPNRIAAEIRQNNRLVRQFGARK